MENIKGGDVAEKAQPVHSASYPFAKEEKWWAYLLYHLPNDPNSTQASSHKRLLLTQVITAQDRLDSEPIYAEIDELLQNLKIAKKREDEEDEKKAAEKEARREVKRSKNPEYDSDEDSDDEDDDGYEDRVFDKCESLVIEDQIEKLRKSLPTRFKFRGPDKPDTYKFTVVRYDLLLVLLVVVVFSFGCFWLFLVVFLSRRVTHTMNLICLLCYFFPLMFLLPRTIFRSSNQTVTWDWIIRKLLKLTLLERRFFQSLKCTSLIKIWIRRSQCLHRCMPMVMTKWKRTMILMTTTMSLHPL